MCTMNAKDRIQQYIDYKGISNSKFEIEVGLSNGYWRKYKKQQLYCDSFLRSENEYFHSKITVQIPCKKTCEIWPL